MDWMMAGKWMMRQRAPPPHPTPLQNKRFTFFFAKALAPQVAPFAHASHLANLRSRMHLNEPRGVGPEASEALRAKHRVSRGGGLRKAPEICPK